MLWAVAVLLLLTALLAASRFLFKNWVQPSKLMKWYRHTLEGLGYKVVALPFQPFKIPLTSIHKYHEHTHQDAFY